MDERCNPSNIYNYTMNEAEALLELYSTFEVIAITVLMPIILSFGILSNAAFLFMLYRVPKMRTITNFYLANLAVSDTMHLAFSIISKIYEYRISSVSFHPVYNGLFSCLVKTFVVSLSYYTTLFMVSLVSLEKYYAICRPLRHRIISGWDRTVKLTVGAWAISLISAASEIPSYCSIDYYCFVWPHGEAFVDLFDIYPYCSSVAKWTESLANINQTVPFFTAVTMGATLYTLIVRRLTKRVDQPHGQSDNAQYSEHAIKIRNQVARMLIINGTLFFLLLSPFEIFSLLLSINTFLPDSGKILDYYRQQQGLQVFRLLSYFNSAINPFVYGMVNSRYRHAFKVAFFLTRNNRVDAEQTRSRQNHLVSLQGEQGQEGQNQLR